MVLCVAMILEYFIDYDSTLFYFIKEYLLLLSYSTASYYFIFQAYFLLTQSNSLKILVFSSAVISVSAFVTITIIFGFNLIVGFLEIPCDNYLWIIMRSLGLMMSTLFVFMGIMINKKINSIRSELNQTEVKSRLLFLW